MAHGAWGMGHGETNMAGYLYKESNTSK